MSPPSSQGSTKTEILAAIAKTDDHNLKMVLLLMLGIMEEIGTKIDRIYTDKALLKESVLNGHAEIHHDDHEWIKKHREDFEIRRAHMERAKPALIWVEERMEEEKDTRKLVKNKTADAITDIIKAVLWLGLGVGVSVLTHGIINLPLL